MTFARRLVLSLFFLLPAVASAFGQQSDDPIWTTQPTHIDRANQDYERLPARTAPRDDRVWIAVPQRIKVLDSRSFTAGDITYEFDHIRPVKPKRLCRAMEGGRWACGRMASIFLGNLVRGKRLLCNVVQGEKKLSLNNCVIGSRDVASAIVSQGYGQASGDARLLAVQTQAQKLSAKGLWRNPGCAADFDGC